MNIDLIVDQNHSYRQALRVAYDKAMKEGGVDEITEKCAQRVFNHPYPDAVYHESYSVQFTIPTEDGGYLFNAWDPWEVYEQAKINDRKDCADWLASEMYVAGQNLSKEAAASGLRLEDKLVSFVVDEKGLLKAVSPLNQLSPDELSLLSWRANQNEEFKKLASEYANMVTSLMDCTIDGLDATYARYFSSILFNPSGRTVVGGSAGTAVSSFFSISIFALIRSSYLSVSKNDIALTGPAVVAMNTKAMLANKPLCF